MADSPTFKYNKQTQRYQYTSGDKNGQFVSEAQVKSLIESFIVQTRGDLKSVTDLLLDGKITVSTWESAVAKELKLSHIDAYQVGLGSKMTYSDWGFLGSVLRKEYSFLRQFSQDILDGKLSKAQILNRIGLYQDALYVTYSQGVQKSNLMWGARWEKWVAVDDGGTCTGCHDQAAKGWVMFGSLPQIGSQQCMNKCRCSKTVSRDTIKPSDFSLGNSYGWLKAV